MQPIYNQARLFPPRADYGLATLQYATIAVKALYSIVIIHRIIYAAMIYAGAFLKRIFNGKARGLFQDFNVTKVIFKNQYLF